MKKYIPLFVLFLLSNNLFAQSIPEDFVLKKIIQAKDLVVGSPSDILFNDKLTHMVISYDSKPTYLAVYTTNNWEKVNQIEVPGFLYLGQSYFDCDNGELLYGDYGNNKPKYYSINILSDYQEKVSNKDLPSSECGEAFIGKAKLREQIFRVKDQFIVVINHPKKMVKVFAKKVTRT